MKKPIPSSQSTTDSHSVKKHNGERADALRLSAPDQKYFAQALLTPPQQSPALKRAFERREKLLRKDLSG